MGVEKPSTRLHLRCLMFLPEEPVPEDDVGGDMLHGLFMTNGLPFVSGASRAIVVVTFDVFCGAEQSG
jgi:hypothetical protein